MSQPRVVNSFDQIDKTGEFKRTSTDFHCKLDGKEYIPEKGRYTLIVSGACPWAHRTLIARALKGLEEVIDVMVVHPVWGVVDNESGRKSWVFSHPSHQQPKGPLADIIENNPFDSNDPKASGLSDEAIEHLQNINLKSTTVGGLSVIDKLYGKASLKEIYELHDPSYVGRYTVPLLFDTKTKTIVNNESAEILQILDTSFQEFAKFPEFSIIPPGTTREAIEAACEKMYQSFNNGVYRAGFARSQVAYLTAKDDVYNYLDYLEGLLQKQRFICGSCFSEADIRCFVTLVRFDSVYISHFKLSAKRIADYPAISDYLADIWQHVFNDTARESLNQTHIKYHYYCSHEMINPFAIVPATTPIDFTRNVEDRSKLGQ